MSLRPLLILLLFMTGPTQAVIESYTFDNAQQEQRYQRFIAELRCPKCQNQNLAGSDAPIAADLRHELHRLLMEGKTDAEITEFMVARYGDFILYRPRVKPETIALWAGPALMLLIGGLWVWRISRRSRAAAQTPDSVAAAAGALNESDRDRLRNMLDDKAKH